MKYLAAILFVFVIWYGYALVVNGHNGDINKIHERINYRSLELINEQLRGKNVRKQYDSLQVIYACEGAKWWYLWPFDGVTKIGIKK